MATHHYYYSTSTDIRDLAQDTAMQESLKSPGPDSTPNKISHTCTVVANCTHTRSNG